MPLCNFTIIFYCHTALCVVLISNKKVYFTTLHEEYPDNIIVVEEE